MRCPHCQTFTGAEDCLICGPDEKLQDLETVRQHALVMQLIHLFPQMRQQGPDTFLRALNLGDQPPDGQAVARLARLVVCAVGMTANLSRIVLNEPKPGEVYAIDGTGAMAQATPPQWTAARLITAALNRDSAMAADLLLAAVGDCCGVDAVERLVELLFWVIATAVDATRFASKRRVGTP